MKMQAKVKLPRFDTEASKRHDSTYHNTKKNIFPPGSNGMRPSIEDMLEATASNIASAMPIARAATLAAPTSSVGRMNI